MNKNLTSRTINNFFWLGSVSTFQSVLQVGILAILARLITPEGFGVVQASLIVVGFAKLMSQMGVGPALVQRKELNDNHIRTGFTISLCLGLFFGVLTYLTSDLLAAFFRMPSLALVLKVVSVIFLIESFVVVSESLVQRSLNMKRYSFLNMISYLLGFGVVGIGLAYLGYGKWALVYGLIFQTVTKAILFTVKQPHSHLPLLQSKEVHELFYFGSGFTIARFANYFATQADNIIVGRFLGAGELGIYSRAYALIVKPLSLIGTSLDKAVFPAMARIQDDTEKLKAVYLKGVGSLSFIAFPISILMILLAPEIVNILLGPNWSDVIVPFQILAIGFVFRMAYKMSESLARATGAVYRRAWRQIVYAISVLAGALAGQQWGINGVATGVVIALAINYLLMNHLSLQILNLNLMSSLSVHLHGLRNAAVCLGTSYVIVVACRYLNVYDIFTIFFAVGFTLLLFYGLFRKWPRTFLGETGMWLVKDVLKLPSIHS